jgi:hypothetical protein
VVKGGKGGVSVRVTARLFALIAFGAVISMIGFSSPAFASTTDWPGTANVAPQASIGPENIGPGDYEYITSDVGDAGFSTFGANPGRLGVSIVAAVELESYEGIILGTNLELQWVNRTTGAHGEFGLPNSEGMSDEYLEEFDVSNVGAGNVELSVSGTIDTVGLGESIIIPLVLSFYSP